MAKPWTAEKRSFTSKDQAENARDGLSADNNEHIYDLLDLHGPQPGSATEEEKYATDAAKVVRTDGWNLTLKHTVAQAEQMRTATPAVNAQLRRWGKEIQLQQKEDLAMFPCTDASVEAGERL